MSQIVGILVEIYHFFGKFAENLASFKFPKFPTFGGIPPKSLGFSGIPKYASSTQKKEMSLYTTTGGWFGGAALQNQQIQIKDTGQQQEGRHLSYSSRRQEKWKRELSSDKRM